MAEKLLRVAIAASGAGHVRRGIEVWAAELRRALAGHCDAVLFQGAPPAAEGEVPLPCLRRDSPFWGGSGSPLPWTLRMYIERLTFAPGLLGRLGGFDILHTADPFLAVLAQYLRRIGLWRGNTIISYQGPGPIWKFYANRVGFVQFLAPSYLEGPGRLVRDQGLVAVIPNFVDTEFFSPGPREAARERFGLPPDAPVVLSVGAFTGMKGIPLLARGAARLRTELPNLRLVLAGQKQSDSGPILAEARELLGEFLVVRENLSRAEMPDLYRAADCFALGSPFEPFGIAFLEAMACGIPVLGNDIDPTRWIVGAGGLTADVSDPDAIAAALKRLLTQPEFSRSARERAQREFSREAVIPRVLDLYRRIAFLPAF